MAERIVESKVLLMHHWEHSHNWLSVMGMLFFVTACKCEAKVYILPACGNPLEKFRHCVF